MFDHVPFPSDSRQRCSTCFGPAGLSRFDWCRCRSCKAEMHLSCFMRSPHGDGSCKERIKKSENG